MNDPEELDPEDPPSLSVTDTKPITEPEGVAAATGESTDTPSIVIGRKEASGKGSATAGVDGSLRSEMGCLLLPLIGWIGLCVWFFSQGLPWWQAVPIGVISGSLLCFLIGILINSGGGSVLEIGIGSMIGLLVAFVLVPTISQAGAKARQATCLKNLKQINTALLQYATDYDNTLPPAARWADAALPYLQKKVEDKQSLKGIFQCKEAKTDFSYALDSRLSGKVTNKIPSPPSTMLTYDSTAGQRNASDAGTSLPKPGRHLNGNTIGYADGHVRWIPDGTTPEQQEAETEAKQDQND